MSSSVDVLFVTHLEPRRDTGDTNIYRPLRMTVNDCPATIPLLRLLAQDVPPNTAIREYSQRMASSAGPPVLTPFFLRSYLERRDLRFVEIPTLDNNEDVLREHLDRGVGLVALCTTWLLGPHAADHVRSAAATIRRLSPTVPILVGGIAARKGLRARRLFHDGRLPGVEESEMGRHFLLVDGAGDACVDAVAIGEDSAATLVAAAKLAREGRSFLSLPNLAIPGPDGYRFTPEESGTSDLDHEAVDWGRYAPDAHAFEAPVRTGVGCPYPCEFCDFAGLYQPRLRSLESLVAELASLREPRFAFFTDDNVGMNRKRLAALARSLIEAELGLQWRAFLRADTIDAEMADLLAESGCRECLLGIESADPNVLRNMQKRLDPERALEAIWLLDARGIRTQCTFVVGFPGECAKSLDNTVAFLSALPSGDAARVFHRYYLFRFQISPLAPIATPERRAETGLVGLGEAWSHATMNADEALDAVHDVFRRVSGPTHMYMEHCPPEWSIKTTRRVLETREHIQKTTPLGQTPDMAPLLDAVRCAEASARSSASA